MIFLSKKRNVLLVFCLLIAHFFAPQFIGAMEESKEEDLSSVILNLQQKLLQLSSALTKKSQEWKDDKEKKDETEEKKVYSFQDLSLQGYDQEIQDLINQVVVHFAQKDPFKLKEMYSDFKKFNETETAETILNTMDKNKNFVCRIIWLIINWRIEEKNNNNCIIEFIDAEIRPKVDLDDFANYAQTAEHYVVKYFGIKSPPSSKGPFPGRAIATNIPKIRKLRIHFLTNVFVPLNLNLKNFNLQVEQEQENFCQIKSNQQQLSQTQEQQSFMQQQQQKMTMTQQQQFHPQKKSQQTQKSEAKQE
jgi:hypothetical protein